MIVSRDAPTTVVDSDFEDDDVRAMSPRRNSEEVDKLGEDARRDLIEQAQMLQTSLQAIVDRVETVKSEHEKLEGGNKFLQSYVIIPALHPHIYTDQLSGTSASSCKHPESHPLRHPKRARVALEESKGRLFESLLFDICVIMLQHAAASMAEHRLPTQPCIYFMALGAGLAELVVGSTWRSITHYVNRSRMFLCDARTIPRPLQGRYPEVYQCYYARITI
jgi:hypothetical protein